MAIIPTQLAGVGMIQMVHRLGNVRQTVVRSITARDIAITALCPGRGQGRRSVQVPLASREAKYVRSKVSSVTLIFSDVRTNAMEHFTILVKASIHARVGAIRRTIAAIWQVKGTSFPACHIRKTSRIGRISNCPAELKRQPLISYGGCSRCY